MSAKINLKITLTHKSTQKPTLHRTKINGSKDKIKITLTQQKKNNTTLKYPTNLDGTKDKRYSAKQLIKQNGKRDMRTIIKK